MKNMAGLTGWSFIFSCLVVSWLLFLPSITHAATITWDNSSGDGLWSTCTNWSTDTCPGGSDVATFDGTSVTDSEIDAGFAGSVDGIDINSGYTGTITQSRNLSIGNFDYNQADGTFTQGTSTITLSDGDFTLSGGTFNANDATGVYVDRHVTLSGGTYNASSTSVLEINGTYIFDYTTITCTGNFPGLVRFNKGYNARPITIASGCTVYTTTGMDHDRAVTVNSGATLHIGSNSEIGGLYVYGVVYASTTLTVAYSPTSADLQILDSGEFYYDGTGISIDGDFRRDPTATFDATGITITMDGGGDNDDGVFTCTGEFEGTVVLTKKVNGGTATLRLSGSGCEITLTDTDSYAPVTVDSGNTLNLVGDSLLGAIINNGNINASSTLSFDRGIYGGYVTLNDGSVLLYDAATMNVGGSFNQASGATFDSTGKNINLNGSSSYDDSIFTCIGEFPGTITLSKTNSGAYFQLASGCTASLGGNSSMTGPATINGELDLSGYNFTASSITLSSDSILKLQGDESSITTPSCSDSSLVEYYGSGTYSSLSAGNSYCNVLFSGSGTWTDANSFTVNGQYSQSNGTVNFSGLTKIGGGFNHTGGTFNQTGTLNFQISSTVTATTTANTNLANLTLGIEDNPIGYWKFDEASAGIFSDSSGSGADGTGVGSGGTNNTPQPVADTPGSIGITDPYSLSFDGTDDYVQIPDVSLPTGDFTYAAWVYPDAEGAKAILMAPDSSGGNELAMFVESGGDITLYVDGDVELNSYNTSVSVGTWSHVVITREGSSIKLWLNGSQVTTASNSATLNFGSCPLYIGADVDSGGCSSSIGNFFDGNIDDFRVYDRALSSAEINYIYDGSSVSGTLTLAGSNLDLSGNLTITSGTLDTSGLNINLAGNWSNSGTFTPGTGTVTFDGTSQSISGETTFYNLTKSVSAADTLTFAANSTTTVSNTWTAKGVSGQLLSLRSGSSGTQWNIDPQSTRDIEYLDVQDSNNLNASAITTTGLNITDSSNNTNWGFNSTPTVSSLGPSAFIGGGYTSDNTPTLTFTTVDADGDNVTYHIQIDNDSDFSSPVVDYTSASAAAGSASFTVGQDAGSGTYATGSSGQTLSDASYYWRVQATDAGGTGSYTTANSGSVAFQLDATAPTTGSLSFGTTSTSSVAVSISGASDSGSGLATTTYTWSESTSGNTTGATTTTEWILTNLTSNTQYTYTVGVTDVAGNTATTTATSTYTLALAPTSAAASVDSSTQITVTWSAGLNPGTTEYQVTNTTTGATSGWITSTSYVATGLTAETAYTFEVKARNGNSIETTTVSATATTNAESTGIISSGGAGGGSKGKGKSAIFFPPGLLKKILPANPGATLLIGPTKAKVGEVVTLSLVTYTTFGSSVGTGGDTISIAVSGANQAYPTVTDNGNGTYTARYLAEFAGEDIITATINGSQVGSDSDGDNDGVLHVEVRENKKQEKKEEEEENEDTEQADDSSGSDDADSSDESNDNAAEPESAQEPFAIESGLTEGCSRAFSWNRNLSATVYRRIGDGHNAVVANTNANTTWYVDIDPVTNNDLTYRFVFDEIGEQEVTFSASEMSGCVGGASVVEEDIDHDGNYEQLIDGIYQDTDGSSVPLATVPDGLLIDTDSDGEPDTFWNPGVGSSPVILAGDRLLITNGTVASMTMYKPYEQGRYEVVLQTLLGGRVAMAAESNELAEYQESLRIPEPPLPVPIQTTVVTTGATAGVLLLLRKFMQPPFSVVGMGELMGRLAFNIFGLVTGRRREEKSERAKRLAIFHTRFANYMPYIHRALNLAFYVGFVLVLWQFLSEGGFHVELHLVLYSAILLLQLLHSFKWLRRS